MKSLLSSYFPSFFSQRIPHEAAAYSAIEKLQPSEQAAVTEIDQENTKKLITNKLNRAVFLHIHRPLEPGAASLVVKLKLQATALGGKIGLSSEDILLQYEQLKENEQAKSDASTEGTGAAVNFKSRAKRLTGAQDLTESSSLLEDAAAAVGENGSCGCCSGISNLAKLILG
jgi:hypothetical protein